MPYLIALASMFIKALVTSAGSAAGAKLIEAVTPKFHATGAAAVIAASPSGPPPPEARQQFQRVLIGGIADDPAFKSRVESSVAEHPAEAAELPHVEQQLQQVPEIVNAARTGAANLFDLRWLEKYTQDIYGFSDEMMTSQRYELSRLSTLCPIGGENLALFSVKYHDGAGREAHPWTFKEYMGPNANMVRRSTVVAVCPSGHTWPVFRTT
jgi:hypothetical protein